MISESLRDLGDRFFGDQEGVEVSLEDAFDALANTRRRRVLRYLVNNDGHEGVPMDDLTMALAFQELDIEHPDEIRTNERKRVYVSLYQTHLPNLDDAGVIEYDDRSGDIVATPATDRVVRILDAGEDILGGDGA